MPPINPRDLVPNYSQQSAGFQSQNPNPISPRPSGSMSQQSNLGNISLSGSQNFQNSSLPLNSNNIKGPNMMNFQQRKSIFSRFLTL